MTELDLPSTMKTHFPDPADLLNFTLTITPDEGRIRGAPSCFWVLGGSHEPINPQVADRRVIPTGMYKGGAFVFSFVINTNYPHEPPKVKCTQKVCIHRLI